MYAAAASVKSLQLCPTLCEPIDGSPPGFPVPGILQARTLGVGCHFLLQCMKVKNESEVAQSCPTLSDPHGLQPTRLLCPCYLSDTGCRSKLWTLSDLAPKASPREWAECSVRAEGSSEGLQRLDLEGPSSVAAI